MGEDTIRLGSIWGSRVVPDNSDQYYQLSTENWRGIICTFPQFYLCNFLLWTLNYLESQISLLEETICLCLDSPYMYVLETISRVGAIVELTLLAPGHPPGIHSLLPDVWCKKLLFHLSCLFCSCLRQKDKCVLCSSMSTKMEVPLQSELTECLVKARHWLLYMGANFNGDRCWGLREPRLAGETCQLQIVFAMWYVQFSSVAQSCLTLCKPMECITPGLPVLHQLLKPAQTHVHQVDDATQPSHPLSSSSPPAFNLSKQQGLF